MMWKIRQAMPNDAIWTASVHAAVITVTGVKCPYGKISSPLITKLRSREQNQLALSYEQIFTKDLEYVEIS